MTSTTFGRAALLIAAGLLVFAAQPVSDAKAVESQAAKSAKPLAPTATKKPRIHKAGVARKTAKIAAGRKAIALKETPQAPVAESEMSASVANANAQMPAADARGGAAMSGAPPLETAAAEQLTELGKSLTTPSANDEQQPIAVQIAANDQPQTNQSVIAPAPARPTEQARPAASTDAWAQSSLIGKIFIAFGGMLTLASAARMLVA